MEGAIIINFTTNRFLIRYKCEPGGSRFVSGKIVTCDDFKVVRVRVVIRGRDGAKLEQGNAVQETKNPHLWKYTATVTNPQVTGSTISATAFDIPDNETTFELVL